MKSVRCILLFATIFLVSSLLNIGAIAQENKVLAGFIYFYSPTCSSCSEVSKIIAKVKKGNNELQIVKFDISTKNGLVMFNKYCESYNLEVIKRYVPMIIINDEVLIGEESIKVNLEEIVQNGEELHTNLLSSDKTNINYSRKTIGVIGVLIGGLINGLNPCSFAMFFFLISLCISKRERLKEIFTAFILAKFLTFLVLGTILFNVITLININLVSLFIKIISGFIISVLIFLNLIDLFYVRTEKYGKIKLQLPKKARAFSHKIMKRTEKFLDSSILIVIIFVVGIFVSITEFMCTGQIYLITIVTLIQFEDTFNLLNFIYLIIYNIALSTPLIIVAIIIKKSNDIFKLAEVIREKMWLVKLINVLFLSIVLIITIFN